MNSHSAVLKVLDAIATDVNAGGLGSLEAYLALFPDESDVVREEYARLTSPQPDRPLLAGRYRIRGTLGEGAYGRVLLAEDTRIRREVAIKLLHENRCASDDARMRMLREAEAASRIQDGSVLPVYEHGHDGDRPFLVLPRVQGVSLEKVFATASSAGLGPAALNLTANRTERFRWLLNCVLRVAQALAAAHRKGVIHRDVKPSNILIHDDGTPTLIDFGLAWIDHDETTSAERSATLGTPAYAAPETRGPHADLRRPAPSLDVWSLGVVLFQGLQLHRPFVKRRSRTLDESVLLDPIPRLDAGYGRDLRAVIEKALAKSPAQRYADAGAFATDLAHLLNGEPVSARPAGPIRRGIAWCRSRQRRLVSAAVTLLLLGTATVLLIQRHERRIERAFLEGEASRMAAHYVKEARWLQSSARHGLPIHSRLSQLDAGAARVRSWLDSVGDSPPLLLAWAEIVSATGGLRLATGEAERGAEQIELALASWRRLADEPILRSERTEQGLALALIRRGEIHLQAGRFATARDLFREALDIDQRHLAAAPQDPGRVSAVAFGHLRIGAATRQLRGDDLGVADLHKAAELLQLAATLDPDSAARRANIGSAWLEIAAAYRDRNDSEALRRDAVEQLRSIYREATDAFPNHARLWIKRSVADAQALELESGPGARRSLAMDMLGSAQRAFAVDPQDPATAHAVATAFRALSKEQSRLQQQDDAATSARQAIEHAELAVALGPAVRFYRLEVDETVLSAADLLDQQGDHAAAGVLVAERFALVERDLRTNRRDPARIERLCHFLLDERLQSRRDPARALELLQDARARNIWNQRLQRLEQRARGALQR